MAPRSVPVASASPAASSHQDAAANQYFICLDFDDTAPIAWPLYGEQPPDAPDYFTRAFRAMEQHLTVSGLTVHLTWRLDRLPSTGQDVVAIVLGDEWSRIPAYSPDVLATFKSYGTVPPWDVDWRRPNRFNALRLLKQVRTYAHFLPTWAHHLRRTLISHLQHRLGGAPAPAPMYDCPLGYGNQLDLPVRPIHERPTDLFFAGSVEHRDDRSSLRQWLSSPKTIARNAMLDSIETLLARDPALTVDLAVSSAFVLNALHYQTDIEGRVLDETAYSESMMNAKICLVPRGTSPETFRYFEALRYGCVLVTEALPHRWFYDGSPAIQIQNWDELPAIAARLLHDPALLARKQQEALRWWDEVCSPEAVGRHFAETINFHAQS
jgi:hypothetical protein